MTHPAMSPLTPVVVTASPNWEPGDPLYTGRDCYHRPIFSLQDAFTADLEDGEPSWKDAASWPDPRSGHDLGPIDEVWMMRRRERRAARRAQEKRTIHARQVRGRLP